MADGVHLLRPKSTFSASVSMSAVHPDRSLWSLADMSANVGTCLQASCCGKAHAGDASCELRSHGLARKAN